MLGRGTGGMGEGGFVGEEAVVAERAAIKAEGGAPRKRLLQVLCGDPEPMMHHAEVVYRDGVAVGDIRAASYGHSLGGAIGLSMVEADEPIKADWISSGKWEVDIAGTRYPATASLKPMYDATNEKIKG